MEKHGREFTRLQWGEEVAQLWTSVKTAMELQIS
jgi:hypothetical protein